ncbi:MULTISPECIES: phage tail protein [Burkholderia]|uniref:phage tail protein n=1 Tax=Burkholderia TaxID=32008 RepID=UPI0009824CFE|nr:MULTISPECIES: phage tail protein [Burkholderia]AQQ41064.1 phage tail protein [Burkholderia cenocepacia]MBG0877495.1 tail fiber protein [Burkholderia sp. 9775_39]MBG0885493.1 tail fiber protein [Burkholderia sp. 9773_38]ONV20538.1 phage tail protein [Burkholderia cenocepacia]ONV36738.1 phage tail protein [Burkholderia cenocepacia]
MATQIIITDAGRAALVAAGNGGTNAHQVVEIGLANAPFVADKGLTKLPNELKRIKSFGGANVAPDTIHTTLKDDSTDQYSLYGFGLYLDNGVLLAAYGQATPIMEKSPAALLLLSSDMQFATIDATQLVFGDASFLNPPATTERQGVVELATQGEVDAGSDDTRAITPKTAASRYAALTGAKFTGPVVTEFDAGPDTAHVSIRPPSGKNGREGRVRLHGTFSGGNPDTGSRLVATIRSGFDNGAWGREYVDLWLNKTANDAETDAYQARAVRVTYGGRMLIGDVKNDDGRNVIQAGGGATFNGGITARGMDAQGAHFRAIFGDYGAFFRNDGKDAYLLSTGKGDPDGSWTSLRPFSWSLADGTVRINGTGAVTNIGGDVEIGRTTNEGHIRLGPVDGYFYANARSVGWWGKADAFQYIFDDHTFRINDNPVWHSGNLSPLDRTKGGTMSGDLWFDPGKRIYLSEGSAQAPSLTFTNDGAPDTGLYHTGDGMFGITCNSVSQVSFTPGGTTFQTPVQGQTPPAGDRSTRLATTEWVVAAIASAAIGTVVFEPRTTARAGFLKLNGALLKRADYPALWAYAQASGALSTETDWAAGWSGTFSTGDGTTTFRIPELRGEFVRCWDDTRGVDPNRGLGASQNFANAWHAHGASAAASGDHVHSAWTDVQGWHGHHGWTASVGDHQHVAPYSESGIAPFGTHSTNQVGSHGGVDNDNPWAFTSGAGGHNHEFNTEGAGNHGHNVGIGAAGNHSHAITVNGDGANESRPRNVALLAMIRAY